MSVKITTHTQVTVSERRRMPRGLNERAYMVNRPKYKFGHAPGWLLPNSVRQLMSTCTATIWGACGRMADMPEYG